MLQKDKALVGFLVGFIFPIIFFVIFHELNYLLASKGMLPGDGVRLQFICIISIVANVIPASMHVKYKRDEALKGIVSITILYAFAIIFYFHKGLLNG